MAAEIIAKNSEVLEKSTPSPQDYVVDKEKILPKLDRGVIQSKADKITVFEEAMAISRQTPGP